MNGNDDIKSTIGSSYELPIFIYKIKNLLTM